MKINEDYPTLQGQARLTGVDSWKYIEYQQGHIFVYRP